MQLFLWLLSSLSDGHLTVFLGDNSKKTRSSLANPEFPALCKIQLTVSDPSSITPMTSDFLQQYRTHRHTE